MTYQDKIKILNNHINALELCGVPKDIIRVFIEIRADLKKLRDLEKL